MITSNLTLKTSVCFSTLFSFIYFFPKHHSVDIGDQNKWKQYPRRFLFFFVLLDVDIQVVLWTKMSVSNINFTPSAFLLQFRGIHSILIGWNLAPACTSVPTRRRSKISVLFVCNKNYSLFHRANHNRTTLQLSSFSTDAENNHLHIRQKCKKKKVICARRKRSNFVPLTFGFSVALHAKNWLKFSEQTWFCVRFIKNKNNKSKERKTLDILHRTKTDEQETWKKRNTSHAKPGRAHILMSLKITFSVNILMHT